MNQKKPPMRSDLRISRLPRGLEIPSWTFFNSPFRVDFKNVHFYIIWWNLDWDIGKILQGHHFKSILKFGIKHLSTHETQKALMSTPEHWWCHGIMLLSVPQCLWVLLNANECPWVLIGAYECSSASFKIKQKILTENYVPEVFCRYLSQDFTKLYKNWHFWNLHGKGCWKISNMEFLDP